MKTVRYNTFETNSSSQHVLTIVKNDSLYERFLNKEGIFYNVKGEYVYSDEYVTRCIHESNFITFEKLKELIDNTDLETCGYLYYKEIVQKMKEMSVDELKESLTDYGHIEALRDFLDLKAEYRCHIITENDLPKKDMIDKDCVVFSFIEEC